MSCDVGEVTKRLYSTAEEGHSDLAEIFIFVSFHFYMSQQCSPAGRTMLSSVLDKCRSVPLPYLFVSCLSRFSLLYTIILTFIRNKYIYIFNQFLHIKLVLINYNYTESFIYQAQQQTALARGLAWPACHFTGRQTAAGHKHSLCFLVQFQSKCHAHRHTFAKWRRQRLLIVIIVRHQCCKCSYCDYCDL